MVYLEIGAPIEMAFLRPLTANKNPRPAPVAPLAEHIVAERGELGWLHVRCLSVLADINSATSRLILVS